MEDRNDEDEKRSAPERKWRIPEWFPDLDKEKQEKLYAYFIELIQFNGRINLISTRTEQEADRVHIADSILASNIILEATQSVEIFDIGSGNGLPGVVMAILDPKRQIILIDKDARKVEFLKHIGARLNLDNIHPMQKRVEELPEGVVKCAVSRGFASISKSILTLRKACDLDAKYYHMKSDSWVREVAQIPSQACAFWEPALVGQYNLPISDSEFSVVLTKKIQK